MKSISYTKESNLFLYFLGPVYMVVGEPRQMTLFFKIIEWSLRMIKRDQIKMKYYMDRRGVTPPRRVTSPAWGPHLHVNRHLSTSKRFSRSPAIVPCTFLQCLAMAEDCYVLLHNCVNVRVRNLHSLRHTGHIGSHKLQTVHLRSAALLLSYSVLVQFSD